LLKLLLNVRLLHKAKKFGRGYTPHCARRGRLLGDVNRKFRPAKKKDKLILTLSMERNPFSAKNQTL